jgi:hypothetical protein
MYRLTFYPLGNADCCLIDLAGGEKILFDYANVGDPNDSSDLRIDLQRALLDNLADAERDYLDVVAFSHLDRDHIGRPSDVFYLEHAAKYQDGNRIKINTLWVPAAAIIEDGAEDEARILRAEARYRLKQGKRIRIFSRPDKLKEWLATQGLTLESRQHLITDAGGLVPEFNLAQHGVEFFVHSPFASRLDNGELMDRNTDAIVMHATFQVDAIQTKFILGSDADHEALAGIVAVTKFHKNDARLEWDVMKLPHHSSYLSLGPEKGEDKTKPMAEVAWIYEEQGRRGGKLVSSSKPIPTNGDDVQPPHRQAANYYRDVARQLDGEYLVTMEHPKSSAPEPLVIVIDGTKARVKSSGSFGVAAIVTRRPPRAG